MQTARPVPPADLECEVVRPMWLAGENRPVGAVVSLPVSSARELEAARRVRVLSDDEVAAYHADEFARRQTAEAEAAAAAAEAAAQAEAADASADGQTAEVEAAVDAPAEPTPRSRKA